jgi:hypothetical protein
MITNEVCMDTKPMSRNGLSIRKIVNATDLNRSTASNYIEEHPAGV